MIFFQNFVDREGICQRYGQALPKCKSQALLLDSPSAFQNLAMWEKCIPDN
jgi:hypothetical protein